MPRRQSRGDRRPPRLPEKPEPNKALASSVGEQPEQPNQLSRRVFFANGLAANRVPDCTLQKRMPMRAPTSLMLWLYRARPAFETWSTKAEICHTGLIR